MSKLEELITRLQNVINDRAFRKEDLKVLGINPASGTVLDELQLMLDVAKQKQAVQLRDKAQELVDRYLNG